jgi:DNA-binding MarR family transcriptional regulator
MPPDHVVAIQRYYPQIYLACHVDHVRAISTPHRLSAKDSGLLSHLDEARGITAGQLARHLGVAASTLSAALTRLESLGYLTRHPRPRDRRTIELRLTARGAEAMAATSVLDRRRVAGLLARLTAAECRRAVAGLALLARAAGELQLNRSARAAFPP